ncbi:MAG: hypothetical protein NTNFB02_23350 [Nitrospira sp.]
MPVPVPNLDDRRFDDLVREGRTIIPQKAPRWTNHNPADPGITILELFAYVAEMLLYQTNRITDHHRQQFLRMLVGSECEWAIGETTSQNIEEAVRRLDDGERAVTCDDYARLAQAADPNVARAQCIPGIDLTSAIPVPQPNHVSVLIIPRSAAQRPLPSPDMLQRVQDALGRRKLLATHVHVAAPRYVPLRVSLSVVAKGVTAEEQFREDIAKAIRGFLDPVTGGESGSGWPAGQALYLSGFLRRLHAMPHVEYVDPETMILETDPFRIRRGDDGEVVSVALRPDEYFVPEVSKDTIQVSQGM